MNNTNTAGCEGKVEPPYAPSNDHFIPAPIPGPGGASAAYLRASTKAAR